MSITYITVRQLPIYKQMTLEEFLFNVEAQPQIISNNTANTRTYKVQSVSEKYSRFFNIDALIKKLDDFNKANEQLLKVSDKSELYHTFFIPKHSGGLRRIDAPNAELMNALRNLKTIFEDDFKALYHTSAFAYIKHRSTIDAVKRHQRNNSNWYGKFDLSNFFGNTTLNFVIEMFSLIYPFSEVLKRKDGRAVLSKALDLAFLNGGLPQGTPISPLITNIMMIPIDYKLSNTFKKFNTNCGGNEENHQRLIYTRYADDFLVSSKFEFNPKEAEKLIVDTLNEFGAPFSLNTSKTRYGSRAGRNWNLGIMVNKDNNMTIGHKKKRQFQAMLSSYIMDKKNGKEWNKNDVQVMEGYRNYYRMIEGETIDKIVEHIAKKFDVQTQKKKNGVNLTFIINDLSS